MSKPFHHFIPRVFLLNFTQGDTENLWFYKERKPHPQRNGVEQKAELRNLKTIFGKRGLNTYTKFNGNETEEVEAFLADKFENFWKPALQDLINCRDEQDVKKVDEKHSKLIRLIFLSLLRRSPESLGRTKPREAELAEASFKQALSELEMEGDFIEQDKETFLNPKERERITREVSVSWIVSPPSPQLWMHFQRSHLSIQKTSYTSDPLLISSNPILFFRSDNRYPTMMDMILPISSRHVLTLSSIQKLRKFSTLKHDQVVEINKRLSKQSSAIASHNKRVTTRNKKFVMPWSENLIWK